MDNRLTWRGQVIIVAVLAAVTAAGLVTQWAWFVATVAGLGYSVSMVLADLRARRFGTDVLATSAWPARSSSGSTSPDVDRADAWGPGRPSRATRGGVRTRTSTACPAAPHVPPGCAAPVR